MVLVQYIFLQTSNTKGNNLLQTGASKFLQNWLPFTKASLSTALWLGTVGWSLGSMGEPWANWLGRLGTGKLMLAKRSYDIGLLVFMKISNIEPWLFDHTEHVSYIPISYICAIKHRLGMANDHMWFGLTNISCFISLHCSQRQLWRGYTSNCIFSEMLVSWIL